MQTIPSVTSFSMDLVTGTPWGKAVMDQVRWDLVSDRDLRNLLAALNFEVTYEPTRPRADHQGDVGSRAHVA